MSRSNLVIRSSLKLVAASAAAVLALGAANAAEPAAKPAQKCLNDLTTFDSVLQKDGYWFHGSGLGYAYGGEHLPVANKPQTTGYWRARPGYEVSTLMASANILAQRGEQEACETLLSSTRDIYSAYAAELRNDKVTHVDSFGWRRQQIAAAVPVTGSDSAFPSRRRGGRQCAGRQPRKCR